MSIAMLKALLSAAQPDYQRIEDTLESLGPDALLSSRQHLMSADVQKLPEAVRLKLFGLVNNRLSVVRASHKEGTYSGHLARFELAKYVMLDRPASGLFPGAMPDMAELTATCARIVEQAKANAAKPGKPSLAPEQFAGLAKRLLGVNTGADQICELIVHALPPGGMSEIEMRAFDTAGFNVVFGQVKTSGRSVHISFLKASHGRDVGDLEYTGAAQKMAGRGNARAVAEALQGAVDCALDNGFDSLTCHAGTVDVCELYMKMGFKRVDGSTTPAPQKLLKLDLADPEVVQQMMFVFAASRMGISDVPKNVAEKMAARGEPAPVPTRWLSTWGFDKAERKASFALHPEPSQGDLVKNASETTDSTSVKQEEASSHG